MIFIFYHGRLNFNLQTFYTIIYFADFCVILDEEKHYAISLCLKLFCLSTLTLALIDYPFQCILLFPLQQFHSKL